jgi:TRAP-type mannitol/chloroaromatic compound transport system permease small subunit
MYAGWTYAAESWRYQEVSVYSPADIPIFPLKTLIPAGATALLIQGIAEVVRCVVCLRNSEWPPRLHDVEELETAIVREQRIIEEPPVPGTTATP